MSTLSTPKAKPGAGDEAATRRFRFTLGHVLAALLLVSLLAWGLFLLLIKLVFAELR
jgi:hypothetical protein